MSWKVRHEGSPRIVEGLTLEEIIVGLREGQWETTDEVLGPTDRAWQPIENHPQLAEAAAEVEPPPPRRHEDPTHLDMNALIDVCLVLLIFFILTSTYAAAVQKVVPMPTVKSDGSKVRKVKVADVTKRMIRLQVYGNKTGKPLVRLENQTVSVFAEDGQTIDPEKLREALRPLVKGEDGKTEVILDARDISWGTVIQIQDAAKSAGIRTIHFLLRKTPAKT